MTADEPACPCVWLGKGRTDNKGVTWGVCWAVSLRLDRYGVGSGTGRTSCHGCHEVLGISATRRMPPRAAPRRDDAGHGPTAWSETPRSSRNAPVTSRDEDAPKVYFWLRLTPQDCLPKREWKISGFVRGGVTSDSFSSASFASRGGIGARKDPAKNLETAPTRLYSVLGNSTGGGGLTYTAEVHNCFGQPQKLCGLWLDYEWFAAMKAAPLFFPGN
jgi:hypothetical protein